MLKCSTFSSNKTYVVRYFTTFAAPATFPDSDFSDDTQDLVIQDKDLLRKSHHDSGTGLHVLHLIHRGSLEPDRSLYNTLFKKCTLLKKLDEAKIVHAHVNASLFKDDLVMQNTILNTYCKCGSLDDAHKFFEEMPMLRLRLKPNQYTLSSVLKASGMGTSDKYGRHVHAFCFKYGYVWNVYVGSSLLDMYARFGRMDDAWSVFDTLESKNEVSWNALIAGHARKGEGEHALKMFLGAYSFHLF
ncbi:hypothetical protein QYF36_015728 [Acer negundo]|nr:hypothetical protein QYF36_015728 [Acer negundo]